ncbi:MAG: hypothetical protein ACK4YP_12225, partial [Myxococcota bacterium]
MLLALIAAAWPHGATFGALQVAVSRDDPDEMWVLTEGWGLAHTTDGGGAWDWLCEEALGGEALYGVVATGPGAAIVASRSGLRTVGGDCGTGVIPGTEGVFFPAVAAYGGVVLGLGIGEAEGGVWTCDATGCAPTDLAGPGLFPKSALADGARAWVTVVYEGTLAAELWRSDDGTAWTRVHAWPDGDTDPRVLHADGDHLLVWRRTRAEADVPELLVSNDGGATFTSTLQHGWYTDDAPGLLVLDDALLLGSVAGARTWRSEDRGATWAEVSAEVPAVRCGDSVEVDGARVGFACGDHLQDGFDLSRTDDGRTWVPVACLEDALPAACADDACGSLLASWQTAGSYGGGKCDTVIEPPRPLHPPEGPCGCGDGGAAGLV